MIENQITAKPISHPNMPGTQNLTGTDLGVSNDVQVIQSGTTTFIEDAAIASSTIRNDESVQLLGPPAMDDNSISDFFAKPRLLYTGTWATTDGILAELQALNIWNELTSHSIWSKKLAGYNLIRATAVVRVVINALPFQQGRLMVTFIPNQPTRDVYMVKDTPQRFLNRCQATQLPHVELDCRSTSTELVIPYVAPTSHINVSNPVYTWGVASLRVLSPLLVGTGSNTVGYSIFMYFKDLELSAPIFTAEAGGRRVRRSVPQPTPMATSDVLVSEEPNGLLSNISKAVVNAADSLSIIPEISWITKPVGAIAGVVGDIAKIFGFSKPLNTQECMPVLSKSSRYMVNANPSSNAVSYAVNANAKLEPINGFAGSDVDEMAINYLKSIPAFIDGFSFATSATVDQQLYSLNLRPYNISEVTTKNASYWRSRPPAFWLASHCLYWRGSINITMKFIKTVFHSGRLLVTFTPYGSTSPTLNESAYSLRQIIDIRETDEITINLPYNRESQWLTNLGNTSENLLSSLGRFSVRVLNPLVASDTCASSVQVMIYASGGHDFEIAVPLGGDSAVYYPESKSTNAHAIGDSLQSVKQIITRQSLNNFSDSYNQATDMIYFNPH